MWADGIPGTARPTLGDARISCLKAGGCETRGPKGIQPILEFLHPGLSRPCRLSSFSFRIFIQDFRRLIKSSSETHILQCRTPSSRRTWSLCQFRSEGGSFLHHQEEPQQWLGLATQVLPQGFRNCPPPGEMLARDLWSLLLPHVDGLLRASPAQAPCPSLGLGH